MAGLESAWSDATEMAADDAAVSSMADALDLASALIKLSRLAPVQPSAELSTALLPVSCTALRARVERLYSWNDALIAARRERAWWYVLPPALAIGICLGTMYSAALAQMHAATEWLVR
jgi:Zn-dependent protease with chaperone function